MADFNTTHPTDSRKGGRPVGRPRKLTHPTDGMTSALAETLLGNAIESGPRDMQRSAGLGRGVDPGHGLGELTSRETATERAALPRELQDFVDASVAAAFAPVADDTTDDSGRCALMLSPAIERIRRPAAAVERREGKLIEKAIQIALAKAAHRYIFLGKVSVPTWKSARELCEANASLDMRCWTVPVSGLPDDSVEFDAVVATTDQREILALEIKRMASPSHQAALNRSAGTMTLRHAMGRRGIHCPNIRSIYIVWYAEMASDTITTRHTIDDVLGVPVRALVDGALLEFKTQFEARYRKLIASVAPILNAEADRLPQQSVAQEQPFPVAPLPTNVPSLAEILADLSSTRRPRR